jgi:hypothetical protein
MSRTLCMLAALAIVAACGGSDNNHSGQTSLTGALVQPPPQQCVGCTVNQVVVNLLGLNKDAPPTQLMQTLTDAQGNYNLANVGGALGGRENVIVVASISQAAGLGGVEDLDPGTDNGKDFNVKTQIACQASVFMTQGTAEAGDPGCVVRALCTPADGSNCLPSQSPTQINNTVIARLEQASNFIAASVVLPNDVNRAACAAIDCTLGGLADATSQCMTVTFGSS